jgi:DNA-binding GntR family transcriptional regulator
MIDAIEAGDADRAEELVYLHSDEFRERMKTFVGGVRTGGLTLGER